MKTITTFIILLSCISSILGQTACIAYEEVNGLIIMEAENTATDYTGLWGLKTDVPGYKGSGHLEFLLNETRGGSPRAPLSYTFQIHTPGSYRILLRARKRIAEGDDQDKSNDCYIRVEGNYTASDNANDEENGFAKLEILQADTKIFGGNIDNWGKAFTLDLGRDGKRVPLYRFEAEETYTFVMSGRSRQYNVDRIIFYKVGNYGLNQEHIEIYDATPETTCNHFLAIEDLTNTSNTALQILNNPVKAHSLLVKQQQQTTLQIINMSGKLLQEIRTTNEYMTIDVSAFPAGIYVLKSEKHLQRFLIQ